MVSRQDIQATCDDIVREFAPLQVILFGSYAYGTPTEHSDVDLLVVMQVPKAETRNQASEIQERIPHRFKIDLLVRSPEELAYRISYNDWFLREITERGEVLYEADGFYPKPYKKENTHMNPLTLEWIQKAEGDYDSAQQLLHGQNPVPHVICFLAQQCVEKYLKAWLQEAKILFLRTHNLQQLLSLILPSIPSWASWTADLSTLSKHAVDTRYPGAAATVSDMEHAMKTCEKVRQAVRKQLKLPAK